MNLILCGQSRLILKFERILAVKMFLHWPKNAKILKLKGLQHKTNEKWASQL
jgi:hypothetical protein